MWAPASAVLLLLLNACAAREADTEAGESTSALTECTPTAMPFGGGAGTAVDPYRVCSSEQLQRIGDAFAVRHYVITRDIALDTAPLWSIQRFVGHIDGRNHKLLGLKTVVDSTDERALFIRNDGVIENLRIEGARMKATAVLAVHNTGLVRNVTVSGILDGVYSTRWEGILPGGVVGLNDGDIVDVAFTGTVRGGGTIAHANGVAGRIAHARASGSVDGSGEAGGIVARNEGVIYDARFKGNVKGQFVGGLVGMAKSTSRMSDSVVSEANLTTTEYVGAIAGELEGAGTIERCAFTGSIPSSPSGYDYRGVLLGIGDRVATRIRDSYAIASRAGSWPEHPADPARTSFVLLRSGDAPARAFVYGAADNALRVVAPGDLAKAATFGDFSPTPWNLGGIAEYPRLRVESDGTSHVIATRIPVEKSYWQVQGAPRVLASNAALGLTFPLQLFAVDGQSSRALAWLPQGEYTFELLEPPFAAKELEHYKNTGPMFIAPARQWTSPTVYGRP